MAGCELGVVTEGLKMTWDVGQRHLLLLILLTGCVCGRSMCVFCVSECLYVRVSVYGCVCGMLMCV